MELDEAKHILGMIAGRKSGVTTVTLNRDAARVVLDYLDAQGEPSDLAAHFEVVAYADDIAEGGDPVPENYEHHYCDWDGEDWPCARIRSVQGEPSDAAVDAARGALPQFTLITREHMRAALRAAGGVR